MDFIYGKERVEFEMKPLTASNPQGEKITVDEKPRCEFQMRNFNRYEIIVEAKITEDIVVKAISESNILDVDKIEEVAKTIISIIDEAKEIKNLAMSIVKEVIANKINEDKITQDKGGKIEREIRNGIEKLSEDVITRGNIIKAIEKQISIVEYFYSFVRQTIKHEIIQSIIEESSIQKEKRENDLMLKVIDETECITRKVKEVAKGVIKNKRKLIYTIEESEKEGLGNVLEIIDNMEDISTNQQHKEIDSLVEQIKSIEGVISANKAVAFDKKGEIVNSITILKEEIPSTLFSITIPEFINRLFKTTNTGITVI